MVEMGQGCEHPPAVGHNPEDALPQNFLIRLILAFPSTTLDPRVLQAQADMHRQQLVTNRLNN